jgi:5'-methylthioadenosine/S-adenosylhomocysteine nucleosidase
MTGDRPVGLVAVQYEAQPLRTWLEEEGRERLGDATLRLGRIAGRRVALAEVLVGPVHAALGAQALILRHRVDCLISFGSAGALTPTLGVRDLVAARRVAHHDAGIDLGSGFIPLGVMSQGRAGRASYRRGYDADPDLLARALAAAERLGTPAQAGMVVSGSGTLFSPDRRRWLGQTYGAIAVDMESAAVAQTALAHNLPWVAVRAISDVAADEPFDFSRLLIYLDGARPYWRQSAARWLYLLAHPVVLRRALRLQHGLSVAARRAAEWVTAMLRA